MLEEESMLLCSTGQVHTILYLKKTNNSACTAGP